MGLFSIKPKSAAEIEPHVHVYEEMHTGWYGNTLYVTSAETSFPSGAFSFFSRQNRYMLDKKLAGNGLTLPWAMLGRIQFNHSSIGEEDGLALVELPISTDIFKDPEFRYVDTSVEQFQEPLDETVFCVRAIAIAAHEYLEGAPEPANVERIIDAARITHDQRAARIDRYLQEHMAS